MRILFVPLEKDEGLFAADEECEFREIQYSEFDVDGVIALLLQDYLNPPS